MEPIKVFFSYSHQDEEFKDELVKHLSILQRQGVISGWHDRMIAPGTEWDREIDSHLDSADIILLLVSPDFLHSEYCWGVEVQKAMQRHEAGEACVIPVVLRWVDWKDAPFAKLQALPKNAKPIKSWEDQDEAFTDTVQGIRRAASTIRAQKRQRVKQQRAPHELISVPPSNSEVPVEAPSVREPRQKPTPFSRPISIHKNFKLLGLTGSAVLVVGFVFYFLPRLQTQLKPQPSESPTVSPTSRMSAKDFVDRGLEKREKGDNQGAIADFDQAIKLKPNDLRAYNNRGIARADLGDKQGAIADFDQAIKLKLDHPSPYSNRGVARSDLGDKQGAIADFNQAIKLKPDFADAYYNRGNTRSDLGDKQGAIADYSQAIKLKPDAADAYKKRGNAHLDLGNKVEAIRDYQETADLYQQQGKTKDYQDAMSQIKNLQSY